MPADEIIARLFAQTDADERHRQVQLAPIVAGIALARRQRETVQLGKLLLKAKAIVPYREWTAWLIEIDLPYHHAVKAMNLAKADRAIAQRWAMKGAAE